MNGRVYGLDALRGVAALVALLFHAALNFHIPKPFPHGYVVVDFFFMLSGYVMARTYDDRLRNGLNGFRFFAARYLRLWPTMAVGGVIGLPLVLFAMPEQGPTVALLNFLLLPVFVSADIFPLNGPAWSIFFELTVNLFHGFVLWRLGTKALIACSVISLMVFVQQIDAVGGFSLGTSPRGFGGGFFRALLSYSIGIVLYRLWRDRPPFRLPQPVTLLLIPGALIALYAILPTSWYGQMIFVLVICPIVIAGGLSMSPGRWAAAVGALSFPLYATHVPILHLCRFMGYGALTALSFSIFAAVVVVVAGRVWRHHLLGVLLSRRVMQGTVTAGSR